MSAEDLLKYEDWEGVFDRSLYPPPPKDSFSLYPLFKSYLTFPNLRDWKTLLFTLSIANCILNNYLNYRQYKTLRRSTKPKVLRNIITDSEFRTRTEHDRASVKFDTWSTIYKLTTAILIIQLELLPKIWIYVDEFIYTILPSTINAQYETLSGQTLHNPLFYMLSALLWIIVNAPVTYTEHCIIGPSPTFVTKTTREWLSNTWTEQFHLAAKVLAFILLHDVSPGVDAVYRSVFDTLCLGWLAYIFYSLFISSILPSKWLDFTPLKTGKTRTAIERVASEEGFRLAGVYTLPDETRRLGQSDVFVYGTVWRRYVVVFEGVLERCDADEVVALAACEMGSWLHYPFYMIGRVVLYYWVQAICVFTLLFNWTTVCTSFGFQFDPLYWGQHPFQVIVLIMGGVIDPLYDLTYMLFNLSTRIFEGCADKLAVEKGYGKKVAKAVIKLKRGDMDMPVADTAYWNICHGRRVHFADKLRGLGWSGDEDLVREEDGKLFDHWGLA